MTFATCVVAPALTSRSSILIEPPGRSYTCLASRCDASSPRAVMSFLTTGPAQAQRLALVRCCDMVFPKPTIQSVAPLVVRELPAIRYGRDALGEFRTRQRVHRGRQAFPGFHSSI